MIWTRGLLEHLKKSIEGKAKSAVINFEGHDLLVGYATYLIEYLDPKLVPAKVTLADVEQAYDKALEEP